MSRRLLLVLVLGLTFAAITPRDAHADRERAVKLFKQGKLHFEAKAYEDAIRLFSEAYVEYDDEPLIILALAKAYDESGQPDKAVKFYDLFVAHPKSDAVDRAKTKTRAAAIRVELANRPGRIQLADLPEGAKVFLDDRPAQIDATGTLVTRPGAHKLRVEAPGRKAFALAGLMVKPGETLRVPVVMPEAGAGTGGTKPVPAGDKDRTLGWITGGAGLALVATGVTFLILREGTVSDYEKAFPDVVNGQAQASKATRDKFGCPGGAKDTPECTAMINYGNDFLSKATLQRTLGFVFGGVGAVGLGVGTYLLLNPPAKTATVERRLPAIAVTPWSGTPGATLTLRF